MIQEQIEKEVSEIQEAYKEWGVLYEKLEQTYEDLVKSAELMKKMENFYFGGRFLEINNQIEEGLSLDLTTSGEYSIMSEDTIWNATHDQQTLLWKFLRLAVKELDKEN